MPKNDVLMDYSDIAAFSKEVAEHQTNFNKLIEDLDKINESLESSWKGYAAEEFRETFEKLRPQLKNFAQLLSTYQTEINQAIADSCKVQDKSTKRIDRNLTLG